MSALISVERVAPGGESRGTAILVEAATGLIETGRPQWPIDRLAETVGVP